MKHSLPLDIYVIVHDQQIILDSVLDKRFDVLPFVRFLFVGAGLTDRIGHLNNVIIARDLADNIECYPHLLSFTGWYAVSRNSLARSDLICLLEYDVELGPDFVASNLDALVARHRMVGYIPYRLTSPLFLGATPWLSLALMQTYGIDVEALLQTYFDAGGQDLWSASSNAAMSRADLDRFVTWFLLMTTVFRDHPIGAHVHERAVPIFCILNDIEPYPLPDVLRHKQLMSHGIQADPPGKKATV